MRYIKSSILRSKVAKSVAIVLVLSLLTAFAGMTEVNAAGKAAKASKVVKAVKSKLITGNEIDGRVVITSARKYVGKLRYRAGGTSLKNGCDCSGFVYAIFKANGVNFNNVRSSHDMYGARNTIGVNIGTDTSKARAGDIIIYPDHAGLCTSDGTVIQCQSSGLKEQTHAYMKKYFGGVMAIIRLNIVKNPKSGDTINHKKTNSKYQIIKTGKVNEVKYLGALKTVKTSKSAKPASSDAKVKSGKASNTSAKNVKVAKKVTIYKVTYTVVNA